MNVHLVRSLEAGSELLIKLLYELVDNKTILFLSGGSTPKETYKSLAVEKKINPGVVGIVDERFGEPMHKNSNEKMIHDTGLLDYFENKNIPFYGILQKGLNLEDSALRYDERLRMLFANFPKSIGVLGIGEDGHTAGLPAGAQSSIRQLADKAQSYIEAVRDFPGQYKERITMTFLGLYMLDHLIVLGMGSAKKNALEKMFDPSAGSGQESLDEVPARFFLKPEIDKKTILITDQKV